jgi:hypothetical protein
LIPRARLRIVEGAGHMLPLECPDRVNRELVEFAGALGAAPAAAIETPRPPSLARRFRSLTQRIAARALSAVGRRSGA